MTTDTQTTAPPSIHTGSSNEDASARWIEWKLRHAATDRKSARRVRLVFIAIFAVLGTSLVLQLLGWVH